MSPFRPDELLPWSLQRQLDPSSPDVVPGAGAEVNTTHRDWTLLGTVGGPERAVIDPRGLVTPWTDGWSLDWWVGADDTWHLPSRSAGVRQRLVDAAPVVETVARIPGGDLVHRAWAVAGGEGLPAGGAVVVELENASPVPVAVALAVRPSNPLGRAPVATIGLDGRVVLVDGRPALFLPKDPSRVAVGSAATGDAVGQTTSGAATDRWPEGGVRCADGEASAAFLFPLPHTARLRVVLPLVAPRPGSRKRGEVAAPVDPALAPDTDRVTAGWQAQTERAPRIELPEPRLADALDAATRFALLHAAGDDVAAWPSAVVGGLETAELAVALDRHGLHREAERLVVGFADRQGLDGSFAGEANRADAAGAWLHAVAEHIRLSGDPTVAEVLLGPVAKAAHRLQRRQSSRRARRDDAGWGLFPSGASPAWLPPGGGATYHDALWGWRGLRDAAFTLEVAGQPDAAEEARRAADSLGTSLIAALVADAARPGAHLSGGPGDTDARGGLGTVVAVAATGFVPDAAETDVAALLAASVAQAVDATIAGGVWQEVGHAGLSPRLTAWLGCARAAHGMPATIEQLGWLLDRGAPTWSWPELVHPRSGGGCAGEGHHAAATAAFLHLARRLVVDDSGPALDVVPAVPDGWLGQPVEAHGLATAHGRLSFAVRWHGERPALLWELEPHADPTVAAAVAAEGPFLVRAGGFDPSWSSSDIRGEALLAAPARSTVDDGPHPEGVEASPAPSTPLPTPAPTSESTGSPPTEPGGSFS